MRRSSFARPSRRIGFIGFDGVCALDLTGPLEAFSSSANRGAVSNGAPNYELVVIGVRQRSFVSDGGVSFRAQVTLAGANDLDTIIVPGGAGLKQARTLFELSRWLATRAAKTRRIGGICGGIYPLAHSGVLDGRRVTTHWRFAPDVARRFPTLKVKSNASFLKDGPFYTCGSGTAGIEMALSLIREDHGSEFALALARELVVRLRRPGEGESPIDLEAGKLHTSEKLAELPAWIVAHLDDDLSVKALAERAGLCPRHFRRLFKTAFNRNPSDYVEQLRLQEASRRLHASRAPIDSIAASVGYASPDVFRRAFERWLGVSPRAYRKAFGSGGTATLSSYG
ncbi:MAG TPA: helix-turn-helix domain-containing protein [Chthoniobacterales bacterium]|nr:helix-turn-helix domain-containing protein [Chthoniobacterales bacterium]